jgi:hypothetical protein
VKIPTILRNLLSPTERLALREHEDRVRRVTYYSLMNLADLNDRQFEDTDLAQYRSRLDADDFDRFAKLQMLLRKRRSLRQEP